MARSRRDGTLRRAWQVVQSLDALRSAARRSGVAVRGRCRRSHPFPSPTPQSEARTDQEERTHVGMRLIGSLVVHHRSAPRRIVLVRSLLVPGQPRSALRLSRAPDTRQLSFPLHLEEARLAVRKANPHNRCRDLSQLDAKGNAIVSTLWVASTA